MCIPLPLTVTVGRVAALATFAFSATTGVAVALANAAEAATIAIAPFIIAYSDRIFDANVSRSYFG